jgi:hypothetical protein
MTACVLQCCQCRSTGAATIPICDASKLARCCPPCPCRVPNCWVVGLDVTHQCRMSAQAIEGMEGRGRHGTFLRGITQFYLDYHRWGIAVCCCIR